ncbi:hypothetical protein MNBD_GAMMA15-1181, partial [hydrothermal vent metagenome]
EEETSTPAQETAAPELAATEDTSLSLEPLKGDASSAESFEDNNAETPVPADTNQDAVPEKEILAKPETGKHNRVTLAPRSGLAQNALMFGSGFSLILLSVGGYYAWKSSQLPASDHIQSATLIREQTTPVDTTITAIKKAVFAKTKTAPVKSGGAPKPAAMTLVKPQTRPEQARPAIQENLPPATPIRISKKRKTFRVKPKLSEAWNDYQQQNYTAAERKYKQVLHQFPDNRDAMLGLAAIAMYQNRDSVARYYYERVLKKHPGNNIAQVALLSLTGSGDILKDGSQLKHWLQSDPNNPQLHFSLGNAFADSGNWKEAQRAYFEAFRLAPKRADYAFNLAVALDQMALQQQALTYYRKARELAGINTLFSIKQLDQRISRLAPREKPAP